MAEFEASAEERFPRRIGGKYRPIRVLGRGGMSIVYEVEHELTRDRLALKVLKRGLDSVGLARFKREARISTLMKSPHVVRVLDADTAPELQGAPFLVMDLLDGADLAKASERRPQPPETVVGWLRQAARAVDLGHRFGVVHRDLKPENLFLTKTDTAEALVKVLDFGVAHVSAIDESRGTKAGSLVGTPLFMSPEQASGSIVGPHADVWSIGMCAFRLLSGRDYWEAENVTLMLAKIVYEPVLRPSDKGLDLGPAFDEWFQRSCARNPSERWESVGRQVEELARALGCAVHALTEFVPPSHTPVVLSDDFTISRVVEADAAHSLDPATTSAQPGGPGSVGRFGLAVSLVAALVGALFLGWLSREHAATNVPRKSTTSAQTPTPAGDTHPAAEQKREIQESATDSATGVVESTDALQRPSRAAVIGRGAAAVSASVQTKSVEQRTMSKKKPAKTAEVPESRPQASPAAATTAVAAPPRDPLADPD